MRPTAWTVSEIVSAVRQAIEGSLGQVWIKGEVTELRTAQTGHWYFTLRDSDARIRCVMWRTYAQKIRTPPADGTEVYLLARPSFWEERGDLRFAAVALLPTAGIGPQQLARERAREALARDGLFDPSRKRPLPPFPRAVALVTSVDGAALRDMLTVARRRWPTVRLLVVGSAVQGDQAETDLVRALAVVNRLEVDACVVGRGGGSREDLSAFDAESVCRAVAAVRVPVVAAVGHETDVSLTDLVADVRAATPSAAIELLLPDRREVAGRIRSLGSRLAAGLRRRTTVLSERLHRTDDALRHAITVGIGRRSDLVARLGAELHALSPLRILERGYAIPRDARGQVLRRRAAFSPGLGFRLRVSDGEVPARVEEDR
jgi:exodeoxyribonuclease VII large subunit